MRLNTTTRLSKKVFGDFNFIELTIPKDFVKICRISVDSPSGLPQSLLERSDKIQVSEDFLRKSSTKVVL